MQRVVLAAMCAAVIAGCDGGVPLDPVRSPEAGVLHFDAAMLPRDGGVGSPDAIVPAVDGGYDPATDTRLFVPDIPITYTGTLTHPGVELVAWTVREHPVLHDFEFVLAVRNTYGSPLCALTVDVEFFDAGGLRIADAGTLVEGPEHRGCSGTCGFVGCISHGDVGMYSAPLYFSGAHTADEIVSATFETGAINLTDARHTSDLAVTGVTAVPGTSRGQVFTGRLENHARGVIRNPQVWIFGLNAVGRPLFGTRDIEIIDIYPGSAWSFTTAPSFDETYARYVAFADASEP